MGEESKEDELNSASFAKGIWLLVLGKSLRKTPMAAASLGFKVEIEDTSSFSKSRPVGPCFGVLQATSDFELWKCIALGLATEVLKYNSVLSLKFSLPHDNKADSVAFS